MRKFRMGLAHPAPSLYLSLEAQLLGLQLSASNLHLGVGSGHLWFQSLTSYSKGSHGPTLSLRPLGRA